MTTSWEEGIIGRMDKLALSRFRVPRLFARGASASLISAALKNAVLKDKLGPVRPNGYWFHIADSGEMKSPLLKYHTVFYLAFREYLDPSKFTPEGLTDYITGRPARMKGDDVIDEARPPHPNVHPIRDEFSRFASEQLLTRNGGMMEQLSEAWDNHIEGYYTKGDGLQGGLDVYMTMFCASTTMFMRTISDAWWIQGIGERPFYSSDRLEILPTRVEYDPDDFFIGDFLHPQDFELKNLINEVTQKVKILEKVTQVMMLPAAAKIWTKCDHRYNSQPTDEDTPYRKKMSLNLLKLGMIYSASRMSLDPDLMLLVNEEDMQRAADDMDQYYLEYKAVRRLFKEKGTTQEMKIEDSSTLLLEIMHIAVRNHNMISIGIAKSSLNTTDFKKVTELITLGTEKHWLEVANTQMGDRGSLTDEELAAIKPKRGPIPQAWRVTSEGRLHG